MECSGGERHGEGVRTASGHGDKEMKMWKTFKWDCVLPPPPSLFIISHLHLIHSMILFIGPLSLGCALWNEVL